MARGILTANGRPAYGPPKLILTILAYRGSIDAGHCHGLVNFGAAVVLAGDSEGRPEFELVGTNWIDVCPVDKARNSAIDLGLRAGADWILMMDADTYCRDALGLLRMVRDAKRRGFQVVGAPVIRRTSPRYLNVVELPEAHGGQDYVPSAPELHGREVEVASIGAACLAVSLSWIRAKEWQGPWFMWNHGAAYGQEDPPCGEDIYFCRKVRQRGGRILCDGRVWPTHVNSREELAYVHNPEVKP